MSDVKKPSKMAEKMAETLIAAFAGAGLVACQRVDVAGSAVLVPAEEAFAKLATVYGEVWTTALQAAIKDASHAAIVKTTTGG